MEAEIWKYSGGSDPIHRLETIYSERFWVSAGDTDPQQRLSLPTLTAKIIDVATIHANRLGIGNPDMPSPSMGWVLSRLTIDMTRYPAINSYFRLSTWIEDWNRFFSSRCFCIEDDEGKVLGYARSVWMVIDTATRRNAGLSALSLPEELICRKPCPIPHQEKHQPIDARPAAVYRFKYCDLDAYRHVNTVRYVQLLLNQYPLEAYDSGAVARLELSFLHEAVYGETVEIIHKDPALLLQSADSSKPILYARILFNPLSPEHIT